jgi:hypothetical protein
MVQFLNLLSRKGLGDSALAFEMPALRQGSWASQSHENGYGYKGVAAL